jgi:hypothetical protein
MHSASTNYFAAYPQGFTVLNIVKSTANTTFQKCTLNDTMSLLTSTGHLALASFHSWLTASDPGINVTFKSVLCLNQHTRYEFRRK